MLPQRLLLLLLANSHLVGAARLRRRTCELAAIGRTGGLSCVLLLLQLLLLNNHLLLANSDGGGGGSSSVANNGAAAAVMLAGRV